MSSWATEAAANPLLEDNNNRNNSSSSNNNNNNRNNNNNNSSSSLIFMNCSRRSQLEVTMSFAYGILESTTVMSSASSPARRRRGHLDHRRRAGGERASGLGGLHVKSWRCVLEKKSPIKLFSIPRFFHAAPGAFPIYLQEQQLVGYVSKSRFRTLERQSRSCIFSCAALVDSNLTMEENDMLLYSGDGSLTFLRDSSFSDTVQQQQQQPEQQQQQQQPNEAEDDPLCWLEAGITNRKVLQINNKGE